MRSPEEVEEFFESELLPEIREQRGRIGAANALRKSARLTILQRIGILAVGLAVDVAIGQSVFATLCALGYIAVADTWRVRRLPPPPVYDVKQELIGRLVRYLDPGIEYQARAGVPEALLTKSGLWEAPYDHFFGEDRIHGKLGSTLFDLSEIRIEKRYGDRSERLFGGLFFVADFNKEFRSRTYLFPDASEKHLGLVARALQSVVHGDWRGELVQLENPEFERHFRVHSTDPTETRYLLSSSMMRRLRDFRENMNTPMYISFVDGRIHMLIEHSENLLGHVDVHRVDVGVLRRWLGEILFAVSLVEELDLNTRIWSKGSEPAAAPGDGDRPGTPERPRINPAAHLSSDRPTTLRDAAPMRSLLSNAIAGHMPLWKAMLIFGFGGSFVLGQAPVLLTAMGASSPIAIGAVSVLAMLPTMFILWRNAPNCSRPTWTVLTRLGVGLSLFSAVCTLGVLIAAALGVDVVVAR